MSVLIVDDDAAIRDVLSEVLCDEGYAVDTAANGYEALAYLQAAPKPGLILLDLMMPVMNGWEFRAAQQLDPELAAIPVITISANAELVRGAPRLEVAQHLRKPVDLDHLLRTVKRHYKEGG